MPAAYTATDLTGLAWMGLATAALLVGFVKTGLPPLGILIPVVLALTFPTKESVGALLLYLIVGDILAVAFYRREADWRELLRLVPPVVCGLVVGTLILGVVDDRMLRVVIGALVLSLVVLELVRMRHPSRIRVRHPGVRFGVGASAGIATTLANAAGPIMGIYFLSSGLEKARFMGTTAVFFLVVNASKVPGFFYLDMIRVPYLEAFAVLFPLVIVGALIGRRFLAWIPQEAFRTAVLVLTAIASITLLVF